MILDCIAWTPVEVCVPAHVAGQLGRSGLVEVRVAEPADVWLLLPESRVGVAVGDGWELHVHPRVGIPRLLFLLAYAGDPRGWRDVVAGFGDEPDLLSAIANGFSLHATRALERGALRGYVDYEERLVDLRGRVRFGAQIARSAGLPLPVDVTYDDFTADIIENRIVRTAAELLLKLPRIPAEARSRLLRVRATLDEASLLADSRRARMPRITRLNARYAPSLALAHLVFTNASVTTRSGEVSSATFVFDMNKVFEDFVTTALRESLARRGGDVVGQYRSHLDRGNAPRLVIKPDVVWKSGPTVLAIVDAKYKALREASMPNADAYQMLAYCTALDHTIGFLVYAHDSGEQTREYEIRNSGVEIRVRTLDVALPPDRLLESVEALALEIATAARKTTAAAA